MKKISKLYSTFIDYFLLFKKMFALIFSKIFFTYTEVIIFLFILDFEQNQNSISFNFFPHVEFYNLVKLKYFKSFV